jgi:SSS family solute:Na+ symporter
MRTIDLVIFIVYLVGILVFGGSFYRKNKTSLAFTLGNRSIPRWVVTMSIFATFVSSISYLALPGMAYQADWNAFVFSLSLPIAAIIAVQVFVPLYRKVNSPSAYTYLEERFGAWARIYASVSYFLTQLMRIGTILYLLALMIHSIYGWDMKVVIILTGMAVMIYAVLGGIQAVVWTDAIQGIILIAGAVVCTVYLLFNMPEGPGQVFEIARENAKFSLGSYEPDLASSTFWVVLVYGIFINLQNYGIDQNYIQRYIASKTDRDAKRSAFSGGMLYVPVSLMFLFIGTALFAFYRSGAGMLPADLQGMNRSDAVFPYFIAHELPAGITGLLIASIFAAGMSTISTSYNSAATVLLTDYYQRFFKKFPSERQSMQMLYISSLVISICGTGIAMAMINVKSALDAWWKLASIFSGGMLGLFLLGVFSRKKNVIGAVIGVIAGLLIILWLSLSSLLLEPSAPGNQIHTYLTIVLGTSTIFLVGFLVSLFLKKKTVPVMLVGLAMLISACQSRRAAALNTMEIPALIEPGEHGYVSGEFIYPLDDRPTPQCHASTITEIPGGMIAAWFGGQHEKNPDVGIWIARHENGSWTEPAEVANGIQSDTLRYPCWNPVLFQPASGPLILFYKVGPDPRNWWGMMKTSPDAGRTWSKASKLGMGPLGHLIGPVKNKPVQLEDGSILCPSSTEVSMQGKDDAWRVHFELTKDLGKTWQVKGPINDGIEFDAIQPSILVYPGGKMQILCRTQQGVISQSWSEDHGETWGKMTATPLPNPNAGTDAVTLRDGRQLLVYNHTLRKGDFPSGRNMLNVAVSRNGTDWKPVLTLEKAEDEFSYPAVIQAADGLVHITYTYMRQTIKHVVIDPEKLE